MGKQPPIKQWRVGGQRSGRGCPLGDKWSPLLMAVPGCRPPFRVTDDFYKDVHLAFKKSRSMKNTPRTPAPTLPRKSAALLPGSCPRKPLGEGPFFGGLQASLGHAACAIGAELPYPVLRQRRAAKGPSVSLPSRSLSPRSSLLCQAEGWKEEPGALLFLPWLHLGQLGHRMSLGLGRGGDPGTSRGSGLSWKDGKRVKSASF